METNPKCPKCGTDVTDFWVNQRQQMVGRCKPCGKMVNLGKGSSDGDGGGGTKTETKEKAQSGAPAKKAKRKSAATSHRARSKSGGGTGSKSSEQGDQHVSDKARGTRSGGFLSGVRKFLDI